MLVAMFAIFYFLLIRPQQKKMKDHQKMVEALRHRSGGAGRFPGGEGIEREIEFLTDATVSLMGERRRLAPWGLDGGGPGAVGEDWLIRSGDAERLESKCTVEVSAGDRLRVLTPGGGGWGAN